VFFHINADPDGKPWNTRAVILKDGEGAEGGWHADDATMEVKLIPGTRHASKGELTIPLAQGAAKIEITPVQTFLMRGIGYGGACGHGGLKGELAVAREDLDSKPFDPMDMGNLHIQAISKVVMRTPNEPDREGVGVFEQLILGPYRPYGL